MSKAPSFEMISKTATKPGRHWSAKAICQFHYFNPCGAYAAKKASDERIWAAVEAGLCKSGAVFAHGSMSCFYTDALAKAAMSNRVNPFHARYYPEQILEDVKKADAFLANIPDFARPQLSA